MFEHNVFDNGESQTCATAFARASFIDTVKTFEQARQMLGRNSLPEIADIKFHLMLHCTRAQQNSPASTRATVSKSSVNRDIRLAFRRMISRNSRLELLGPLASRSVSA